MDLSTPAHSREDRKRFLSDFFLRRKRRGDPIFKWVVIAAAGYTLLMLGLVAFSVVEGSAPVFGLEGFGFFIGTDWNPSEGRESYGALPYVVGTLLTAGIAMVIGVPISFGIAIFISEIAPPRIGTPVGFVVEILAAIPSIIYGLWALLVFRFWLVDFIERPLHDAFGGTLPFFARTPFGLDIFTAGIVLSIMIIPIISSISREILRAIPNSQREAAYSLGATRRETVWKVLFPYAKAGLFGATIIGLGRAVGETIAVMMVIGGVTGVNAIPSSLFSPSQTLAGATAGEWNEAVAPHHISALLGLAAVLFILTMGINVGAQILVSRMAKVPGGRE